MEPNHPQPSCLPGSHHCKYSPWSLPAQFSTFFFFWSFHSNPSLQLFLLFCYLTVIFLCVGYPLDNELSEKKNPFIFFISSMHTNTYKWSMNVSGINGWKKWWHCKSPCDNGWSWYDDREQRRILRDNASPKTLGVFPVWFDLLSRSLSLLPPTLLQILSKDDPLLTKISSR